MNKDEYADEVKCALNDARDVYLELLNYDCGEIDSLDLAELGSKTGKVKESIDRLRLETL